eukprot:1049686-Rhodomonas_salina.2
MALVIMVVMTVVMMMVAVIMMMMQQPLRADLGHDDPRLVAWSSSTRPVPVWFAIPGSDLRCVRAARYFHEVMPSYRERWALSAWMTIPPQHPAHPRHRIECNP